MLYQRSLQKMVNIVIKGARRKWCQQCIKGARSQQHSYLKRDQRYSVTMAIGQRQYWHLESWLWVWLYLTLLIVTHIRTQDPYTDCYPQLIDQWWQWNWPNIWPLHAINLTSTLSCFWLFLVDYRHSLSTQWMLQHNYLLSAISVDCLIQN